MKIKETTRELILFKPRGEYVLEADSLALFS